MKTQSQFYSIPFSITTYFSQSSSRFLRLGIGKLFIDPSLLFLHKHFRPGTNGSDRHVPVEFLHRIVKHFVAFGEEDGGLSFGHRVVERNVNIRHGVVMVKAAWVKSGSFEGWVKKRCVSKKTVEWEKPFAHAQQVNGERDKERERQQEWKKKWEVHFCILNSASWHEKATHPIYTHTPYAYNYSIFIMLKKTTYYNRS